MAISLPHFSWPRMDGKQKEQVSKGSLLNSFGEWSLGLKGEAKGMNFSSSKGRVPSRKWKTREERNGKIDKEYDMVLVPSDGVCLSGSESEDSDWSIGWLEPHAPGFNSDDEDEDDDDSFAVLVPCYKREGLKEKEEPSTRFFTVNNLPTDFSAENKEYLNQWLSSLQNL